jgi:hypothetical protein
LIGDREVDRFEHVGGERGVPVEHVEREDLRIGRDPHDDAGDVRPVQNRIVEPTVGARHLLRNNHLARSGTGPSRAVAEVGACVIDAAVEDGNRRAGAGVSGRDGGRLVDEREALTEEHPILAVRRDPHHRGIGGSAFEDGGRGNADVQDRERLVVAHDVEPGDPGPNATLQLRVCRHDGAKERTRVTVADRSAREPAARPRSGRGAPRHDRSAQLPGEHADRRSRHRSTRCQL